MQRRIYNKRRHRQRDCSAVVNRKEDARQLHYIDGIFQITKYGESTTIKSPNIERIDSPYIQKLAARCKSDFTNKDYDSVLSKCRTIIEEVLTYIIESSGKTNTAKGDIHKLYN